MNLNTLLDLKEEFISARRLYDVIRSAVRVFRHLGARRLAHPARDHLHQEIRQGTGPR